MHTEYEVERDKLFKEFGWEDNVFTHALFEKAYNGAYGWSEVKCHMYDMDDIYEAALKHFKGEK